MVATTTTAGMALEPGINLLGRIPPGGLSGNPSSGHSYIDKTAILMPDRVDPGPESGNRSIGPKGERVNRSITQFGDAWGNSE